MKTPEELAEEFADSGLYRFKRYVDGRVKPSQGALGLQNRACKYGFLAGYQAAKEHAHAALEEAEAKIQELEDQVADNSKVMNAPEKPVGWISVKQQMPDVHEEVLVNIIYPIEKIEKLAYRLEGDKAEWFVLPDPQGYFWNEEWVTHWMPLPEPPEE
jgi:hypothetical protein